MAAARALGSPREPQEWIKATEQARGARAVVAAQLADLIIAEDITGGRELAAQRIREFAEAERTGDPMLTRAAAMAAAGAFAALCVRFDLRQDHPGAYAA
jgi:hypothetical protein